MIVGTWEITGSRARARARERVVLAVISLSGSGVERISISRVKFAVKKTWRVTGAGEREVSSFFAFARGLARGSAIVAIAKNRRRV